MDWSTFFTPSVLAPGALVGMCVLMILTGQLVTKKQVARAEQLADAEIAHLRATVKSLTESLALIAEAMKATRFTNQIVNEVMERLEKEQEDEGKKGVT